MKGGDMPRVYLSNDDRLNAKLTAWIYGQLKVQSGKSQKGLAEEMGMCQQAVSRKLAAKSYKFTDLVHAIHYLQPDMDTLMDLLDIRGGYGR